MARQNSSQHIPNLNERKDRDAAIIQLASIVESSGDAIFGETMQGVITSWNNSAEKLFDYTAAEILGKTLSLMIPADHQTEVVEISERIKKGEVVKNYETTRMRKDGTPIAVSITVSPIRDSNGGIIASSTIVRDITEQKRMIEELATRTRELESSNAALTVRSRELATRTRELEGSNAELATSSSELEGSNDELAIRTRELEGSNAALTVRSRELEGSNAALATRTRELESSNKALTVRSRELATRTRELERSVEDLAIRTRELEGSNEELAKRSRELESSNVALATRSRELEVSNVELAIRTRELEGSNKALTVRSQELEGSNEALAIRTRELEGSNKALTVRSRELESSNEALATRTRELESSNEELATRSRELESSNEALAIRTRELEGSNEELATRSRELEGSNEELAIRTRELEGSNEELAIRTRELEGSNAALTVRSRELESSNEELATRTQELEGSNTALATRSRELESSNEELAIRTRELEGSNEELATRSRELEGSNEELAIRTRELERSNTALTVRSHELESSNEELTVLTQELERSVVDLATRSRELERASNAAVYQLAAIVASSGDAIFSKTLQGVTTSWNYSAEKLFGYAAGEVIGKSISLIFPPDRKEDLPQLLAQITAGETVQSQETVRLRKNGTLVHVSTTVSPIRDPNGKIIAAATIVHDITEQKRMIAELIALNTALEEANRVRDQFLATMSHELRTPLASIIGFSQMLLDETETANLNQQQYKDLERILRNGQHLLSLINDVLDLTKIGAGHMVVSYSHVDVRELLSSVVEETQSIAIAQHLILRAEVEDGIDFLESNQLKLRQVLLNLISNAIKFTEQGEVMVSAKRVSSPDQVGESIALAVKDSGIGIPVGIQERVFEAFYQADGTYTRKAGGTGLGLSIVSQLTTLLGGTITLESAPGQGSTFTMVLPIKAVHHSIDQKSPRLHIAQLAEATGVLPSSGDISPVMSEALMRISAQLVATDGQNNLILSVDDNPDIIVLIKAALKGTPYTVVGLQDPLQAMEWARELHPSAIMLDVMMPQLNGWQLLNQLKANPVTASIPVMMITVLTEPATGYVLGADAYLIKPFKSTVLLDTLQKLLVAQQEHSQDADRDAVQV